jgi:hypothetical protein
MWFDHFNATVSLSRIARHREQRAIQDVLVNKAYAAVHTGGKELAFPEFGAVTGEFSFITRSLGMNSVASRKNHLESFDLRLVGECWYCICN